VIVEFDPTRLAGRTILQVLPALDEGGVEQSTIDMARYLVRHGASALVASSGGKRVCEVEAAGARHVTLPLSRKLPWQLASNGRRLEGLVQQSKPDIIHARSRGPAWSAWLACRRLGLLKRYITTFHGTYSAGNRFKKRYNAVMLKGPLVIANSQFIANHIQATYGVVADRIIVAPRGVDERYLEAAFTDADKAAVCTELAVPERVPLLLMVGRLTRWKGQHVLLEALATMKEQPWVAAFAGGATSDGYADELRALADRSGIADQVRWLGRRDDIARLTSAATLAFSCSIEPEAFGRVAIEAMAVGTPIIASRLGGSIETVIDGETGFLVQPNDAVGLAGMIKSALSNPAGLADMGLRARTHVRTRFTVDHCCAAEASAYLRLLSAQPAG
jgi:glycosyltransferase involved in cell wall biosynthesis